MSLFATTRTRLLELLESFPARRVAVIGDLALDEFVHGRTARISREAPVLILRHQGGESLPGCAGNAARNLASLGAKAWVAGFVADDDKGKMLLQLLRDCGVATDAIVQVPGGVTWCKSRFLAGDLHTVLQQVMRLDHEPQWPNEATHRQNLHAGIDRLLQTVDGVLLCDYGGGVLKPETRRYVLNQALQRNLPIVADSRYELQEFTGVTCATPNETEIEPLVGRALENDSAVEEAGEDLRRRLESRYLIVTRGKLGMTLFDGGSPVHLPAFGNEAVDVAGAGDTVAATVALSLASGGTVVEAGQLANYAASRVVLQRGTAVTDRAAIRACIDLDGKAT